MFEVYHCHYTLVDILRLLYAPIFFVGAWFMFEMIKITNLSSRVNDGKEINKDLKMGIRIIKIILLGLCIIVLLYEQLTIISDYCNIYLPYQRGEYEITEGKVLEFQTNSGYESFSVNNNEFYYIYRNPQMGYHKIMQKGGFIRRNGQYVKIGYCKDNYDNNVIVKMWIEEKDMDTQ
ncbi:MAG: hypothetical protein E7294_06550 [Lachnospiraceae bacterium]|nr:hypothetical protein [Lachnospiraceae bacterium]